VVREAHPALIKAWDAAPDSNPLKAKTAEQIAVLRQWDLRWACRFGAHLAGDFLGRGGAAIRPSAGEARGAGRGAPHRRGAGRSASGKAGRRGVGADWRADFGTWKTPWGDINRFQRLNDDIAPRFDDAAPSIPVGFPSATWGSLASFGARAYPGTKKWYGSEREQLRSGGGVRQNGAGQGGDGRRRKRQSGVASLQR
jgi:acyl-homoserine-lactone acylase